MGKRKKAKDFDPFDPKHADKVVRRTKVQILADKRDWESRVDGHFRRALLALGEPTFVAGTWLWSELSVDSESSIGVFALRRLARSAMERCGYLLVDNPKTKDGRWKVSSEKCTIFGKKGANFDLRFEHEFVEKNVV